VEFWLLAEQELHPEELRTHDLSTKGTYFARPYRSGRNASLENWRRGVREEPAKRTTSKSGISRSTLGIFFAALMTAAVLRPKVP